MKGGSWTPEEDKTIEEMRAQGASWSAVGRKLNRDPQSCANRWYRIKNGLLTGGGKAAFWTWEEDEEIRKAYATGKPDVKALAEKLGRKESAVETRASDLRLCTFLSKKAAGDGRYVRQCHDCGRPTHNYRCPACLRRWRDKHGVSGA